MKKKFIKKTLLIIVFSGISTVLVLSQIRVRGTIVDNKNEPLVGVNVMIKGTNRGTVSDSNGEFSIEVQDQNSILVFSYLGYKTVEKNIPSNGILNVMLEEDIQTLEELVVVAYGTQKKSHLTGAVATIKNEKLDEIPVSRVDQALQGRIAGLQVINTDPIAGAAPKIRVRGMGSISASSDPLVVIDGFPVPDGLSSISMGDVESIEILKDAASAALYGSRAAGGVILVTTKSGDVKKPKYTFKMYAGTRNALKLPKIHDTEEYTALLFREAKMRMLDPSINGNPKETMAFNKITEPEKASYLIFKYFDDQHTYWSDEALRSNPLMQNYQLSVSGGDKNWKYFFSGNYTSEEGIMKNSTYDKFSARAKVDVNLSKKVKIGINLSPYYSLQKKPGTDLTDYLRFPSWLPIRHNEATAALTGKIAGEYAHPYHFNGISISGYGYNNETWHLPGVSVWSSSNQNPVSIRERTDIRTENYRLQGNMYVTVNIIPDLQFKSSNGIYYSNKEYNQKEQTSAKKENNPNSLTRELTRHAEILSENTLNYNKNFNEHEIEGLLGFTLQKTNDRYDAMVGTGFPDEKILSFNLASQILLDKTTSFYYSESLVSLLGRINYAYRGKYLISTSLRADGSSKFHKDHRWGTFPSLSIGWRVSEENFFKKINWMSNFKIRVSHGLTGNNNIPQYAYMNPINATNYILGEGTGNLIQGMASNSDELGNPDITWEKTSETNYGIDMGFLNNRFNLSIDYYNSTTKALLLQQPAMYITGHKSYWNNIGKVNNKGIEIEIKTTNISKEHFTWETFANLSTNKNTLRSYGDKKHEDNFGERNEVYRAIVGQPSIQYYGYKSDGVYTTFEEVEAAKTLKDEDGNLFVYTKFSPIVGGLKVLNTNGDNRLDPDDRVVLGDPFPDFIWGITNIINFRNFDLSFLIEGVQGTDIINGNANYNEQLRFNKAYTKNRYVSPMFPGDGKTVYSNTTPGSDLMLTDYCIEDGSYVAFRDLTLGYTVPQSAIRYLKINNLRVFFSCQNLFYLMASEYRGINPEARRTSGQYNSPLIDGYQRGAFPLNRTFTVGIDITF